MIINHNISALNTYRNLTAVNNALQKSLERLSSGLRINRAADDAAGLAISEKMRGQIRGLAQAIRNAQDAISLIQTAEGGLNESQAILQRMRELAAQAASDTNTPADRAQIQKEIDQLAQELARIGNTTEFNTMPLLNGTFEGVFHIGANESQNITVAIGDMRSYALGVAGDARYQAVGTIAEGTNTTDANFADGTYTVKKTATGYELVNSDGLTIATSTDGKIYTLAGADDTITFADAVISGTVTINTTKNEAYGTATVTNQGLEAGTYTISGTDVYDASGKKIGTYDTTAYTVKDLAGNILVDFGANVTTFTVGGTDVSTQEAANKAITTIQQALDKVSDQRSALGAYQNRLEHTIANLSVAKENLTAAESRIRDLDMAEEMMTFTRNQIISQAATAMLAQANQVPAIVLQLLR